MDGKHRAVSIASGMYVNFCFLVFFSPISSMHYLFWLEILQLLPEPLPPRTQGGTIHLSGRWEVQATYNLSFRNSTFIDIAAAQQAQAQHNRAIAEARNRSTPHYHQSTAPKFVGRRGKCL
ncbi:hypothetical protein CMV_011373 [Castanea mollissima]|uniref:Uncharacterized protein n=1 Tax=Castanea mollissima TaxID=60419 RepID=A0A8J4RHK3_9ROSI|nr:hypothetical protein CMV_011373 [Castanea mollissima]